ncbi:cadmium-translocating P-type ATPase [Tardiphaga alba]|uniref:Cadmium-translocating P-type ATPase n=1 Tax=Tardiphaga alba TaxID=340268 RepID=A0ABX8A2S2_9BRAD|nr:cation-translocating P-type ATPase [Tardiphaga alba]QUS37446.1 cadmium-translocating P-type ATPase [Tardiphaga alba]
MSCCGTGAELEMLAATDPREILLASRPIAGNLRQTDLSVPDVHCGACIHTVEKAIGTLPGVSSARVNLSTRRVTIKWRADIDMPPPFIETLRNVGYEAHLFEVDSDAKDATLSELIRALAVSGFAAGNIMLLSVSVWSGAEPATRDLFHGISALIALPTLLYSGRVFFRSAWQALSHGRTNMDVPISLGVLLAFGMSLYETAIHGPHAYFDASVTLLFFLLIGRTLDHMMRERARVAVKGLARLAARGALVQQADGSQTYLPVAEIKPGMTILLAAGERVPVDSTVAHGLSEIDVSLITGESVPQPAQAGAVLRAGTLNLTGPLTITATAVAGDSFLAEMLRMMEAAEQGRSVYRRIADRAAGLYAPVVHLTAAVTLIGWMFVEGDWHHAITIAVAVLIITCPCALGLAVPMVQVVAARKLFEHGVMIKDGGALERLAEVDTIVFDKTGTLTQGNPRLVNADKFDQATLTLAGTIAAHSRHPFSRALASVALAAQPPIVFDAIAEIPGCGMEARVGGSVLRLGRPEWALDCVAGADIETSSVVLSRDGNRLADFRFEDSLRRGAVESVAELKRDGFAIEVVSGDREAPVRALAGSLGVAAFAGVLPGGKAEHIADLAKAGKKVLMVGDGLNDTPALMAAHASMAPASAADVGRNAADLVFLRDNLEAVPLAIAVAREAQKLVRQNLALAVGYNFIAVPIAILGYVTPLVAAIAMSGSSIVVVANALRLRGRRASVAKPDTNKTNSIAMRMEPAE